MKKNILTIGLSLFIGLHAFGQNVEREEAENVAKSFLTLKNSKVQKSNLSVSEYFTSYNDNGEVLYHVLNFENGGFVIVSGDKRVEPILAYSITNNYVVDNNRNPAASFWVESQYAKPIDAIKKENVAATNEVLQKWASIISGKQHKAYATEVKPLLTSKWDQDKYYNALCPDDEAAGAAYDYHALTGCVATALAQIMYYHRYPRQGNGSSSYSSNYGRLSVNYGATNYNYEAMTDDANGYSDAIARLNYHIGVAVEMGYTSDGSGANTEKVIPALSSYFRYNAGTMKYLTRAALGNDAKWLDTIKYSLNKGLPVYYAAKGNGFGGTDPRHAFVCDGYDDQDKIHLNWGWGHSDGFFAINQMGSSQYVDDNRIIIGIEPITLGANFFSGTDTITATFGSFNDGSGHLSYQDNTNCSWLISPQGGRFINSITLKVSAFSLGDGDSVYIYAGNSESGTPIAVLSEEVSETTTFQIIDSEAFIVFKSDNDGNVGDGFTFTYTTTRNPSSYCPLSSAIEIEEKITSDKGSIDNGTPAGTDYVSENSCYWAIAPQSAVNQVQLSFSEFNLADGDIIEFLRFPSTGKVLAGNWRYTNTGSDRFSKDNPPVLGRKYSVSTATALVHFKTDNDRTSSGFKIEWDITPIGISDNALNINQLLIFPNPSSEYINVSFTVNDKENVQIVLHDMLGKALYSTSQMEITEQYSGKIDVSNLAKGIYLLQINTSKGTTTKKVIVD